MLIEDAVEPVSVIRRGKAKLSESLEIPEELEEQSRKAPENDLAAIAAAASDAALMEIFILSPNPGALALLATAPDSMVSIIDSDGEWRKIKTSEITPKSAVVALKAGQVCGMTIEALLKLQTEMSFPKGDFLVYDLDESTTDNLMHSLTENSVDYRFIPVHRRLFAITWRSSREFKLIADIIKNTSARQSRFQSPQYFSVSQYDPGDIYNFVTYSLYEAGLEGPSNCFAQAASKEKAQLEKGIRDLCDGAVQYARNDFGAIAWLCDEPLVRKIQSAESGGGHTKDIYRLAYKIGEFAHSLKNLKKAGSELYQAIASGSIPFGDVTPHATKPENHYDFFYATKGISRNTNVSSNQTLPVKRPRFFNNKVGDPHQIRKAQAIFTVEFLFREMSLIFPGEKLRWLDIGSANGDIINHTNPNRWMESEFEIIGVEFAEELVKLANHTAGTNRQFVCSDARSLPDDIKKDGFHIPRLSDFSA